MLLRTRDKTISQQWVREATQLLDWAKYDDNEMIVVIDADTEVTRFVVSVRNLRLCAERDKLCPHGYVSLGGTCNKCWEEKNTVRATKGVLHRCTNARVVGHTTHTIICEEGINGDFTAKFIEECGPYKTKANVIVDYCPLCGQGSKHIEKMKEKML